MATRRERQVAAAEAAYGRRQQLERAAAGEDAHRATVEWLRDMGAPKIVTDVWPEIDPPKPVDPLEAALWRALLEGPGRG